MPHFFTAHVPRRRCLLPAPQRGRRAIYASSDDSGSGSGNDDDDAGGAGAADGEGAGDEVVDLVSPDGSPQPAGGAAGDDIDVDGEENYRGRRKGYDK